MTPEQYEKFKKRPKYSKYEILANVVSKTGIRRADVLGKSRVQSIVKARALACFAMRRAGYSYPSIGAYLNMHHTGVMHHVKRFEGILQ